MSNVVKDRDHVPHVFDREHRVEHLALPTMFIAYTAHSALTARTMTVMHSSTFASSPGPNLRILNLSVRYVKTSGSIRLPYVLDEPSGFLEDILILHDDRVHGRRVEHIQHTVLRALLCPANLDS